MKTILQLIVISVLISNAFADDLDYWRLEDLTVVGGGQTIASDPFYFNDNGVQHVFARDSNGHLREWWWTATSGWHVEDLTASTGGPTIAGNPFYFNENGVQHVFARDLNGHLREWWWTMTSGWHVEDLTASTGGPTITGDPFYFNDNGVQHVFARDSNGHLREWWWTATSGWHVEDLTASIGGPTIEGNPFYFNDNGVQHVFARDSNGHLREWWWTITSGWHVEDLTVATGGQKTIAGDPYYFNDNGIQHVFARDPNGHLLEWWWTATNGWQITEVSTATGGQTIAGDPFYYNNGKQYVFVRDSADHLRMWVLESSIGWQTEDLSAKFNGQTIAGNPFHFEDQSGTFHVFTRDQDGHLREWWAPPVQVTPESNQGTGLIEVYELKEPVELTFAEDLRFPDGVIDWVYSFDIKPKTGNPPYQFSVSSGSLPVGLSLDKVSGLIQGTPSTREFGEFTVQVTDVEAKVVEVQAAIKVYGVLTFGEHGTFKDCNSLQMAFNAVQDLDEIRIEQGTYDCVGTVLAKNKTIRHGIKISGGWDAEFKQQTIEPTLTVFDAGNQWIASADTEGLCRIANGEWQSRLKRCSQDTLIDGRFFTLNNEGPIAVENFSFKNAFSTGNGGAVAGQQRTTVEQCIFSGNSVSSYHGGAVHRVGHINNSTFNNNSAISGGGAVYGTKNIINSTFNNNSASNGGAISDVKTILSSNFNANIANYGGAVSDVYQISNSVFTKNTAGHNGGAVHNDSGHTCRIINSLFVGNTAVNGGAISHYHFIINTTIVNNSSSESGGGFYGHGKVLNSIFHQNTAGSEANDITPNNSLNLDYNLVNNLTGIYDYGTHNIMGEPHFVDAANGDYSLSANSPAIDIGDNTVLEDYTFPENTQEEFIDLNRNLRVIGDTIDFGAYERQ